MEEPEPFVISSSLPYLKGCVNEKLYTRGREFSAHDWHGHSWNEVLELQEKGVMKVFRNELSRWILPGDMAGLLCSYNNKEGGEKDSRIAASNSDGGKLNPTNGKLEFDLTKASSQHQ